MSASTTNLTPDTAAALERLISALRDAGIEARVRSAFRSCREQAEQWSIGRQPGDTRQKVTYAPGCNSWHVMGRAVDLDLYDAATGKKFGIDEPYQRMGAIAKSLGWQWGGEFDFYDHGHVEWHGAYKTSDFCTDPFHACEEAYARSARVWVGERQLGWGTALAFVLGVAAGALGAYWGVSELS